MRAFVAWSCLVVSLSVFGEFLATAQDWPQFLGPQRDGHYRGTGLAEKWPDGRPEEMWRRPVGEGFAGPVVVENRLLMFHREGGLEVLDAIDTQNGNLIWRYSYETEYRDDFGFDEGPRSAPVVVDGRVFVFGAQGQLHAVELLTGNELWHVDARMRFRVAKAFFGAAGTPLVEDGRLIANIGGPEAGIVAFDIHSGDVLWTARGEEASYSSPVGATFGGVRHALFFTRNSLVGLDPATGRTRFERSWRARIRASVNAATPIVVGNRIFASAQYGTGAGVFEVDGLQLQEIWASDDSLSNHYATSVYHNGYLYGFHGRQEYGPSFRAVEFDTGEVAWSEENFGAGTVTLAGDLLVIVKESGELILAKATAADFRVTARAQLLAPVVRAYPALAHGRLYIRNRNELVSFDLRN